MKNATLSGRGYKLMAHNNSLIDENEQALEIPIDGSLGLLALGYVGLMTWRGVKRRANKPELDSYSSTQLLQNHEK